MINTKTRALVFLGVSALSTSPCVAPCHADTDFLLKAEHSFNELAKKAMPAVVSITTVKTLTPSEAMNESAPGSSGFPLPFGNPTANPQTGQPQQVVGIGSGIIIRPEGYILTSNHVIERADRIQVSFDNKEKFPAHLVGADKKTDLAVIQLEKKPGVLASLAFGDSEQIKVGDWAIAVGSPYGLRETVTFGIISAKGRGQMGILDIEDFIQTDAAINPGSSGGPLLNTAGDIIGINTAIFSQGGGFSGIGFAVPSRIAKEVSDQLIAKGRVERGWIGLYAQDLDTDLAQHFHSPAQQGAVISAVVNNGPADHARLESGDVVLRYNSQQIGSAAQLKNLVGRTTAGSTVTFEISRDGQIKKLNVAVQEQPGALQPSLQRAGTVPGQDLTMGLTIEDIPKELADYLKINPHNGAIIVAVRPGSAGYDAGLSPGDIILDVDKKEIHGARDFSHWTSKLKSNDTAVLYVQHGPEDKTFVPVKLSPS
jgi:serine protease Do